MHSPYPGTQHFLSKSPSRRSLGLLAMVNGLIILGLCSLSTVLYSLLPTPLFALSVGGAIALGTLLQTLWFADVVRHYGAKLEKTALTARRFQNISKYFESILQDSTDIIFSVDVEGYILKFNNGSELHFGYSQEEIVGKPLKILFVNEVDERKILDQVMLQGKTINREVPMKTKSGRIILLNLSMSEMKNNNNQIIGLVATAKDITEKKKLELELVKKNEQLSRLAITDSLTSLYNSRHFFEQIKRELSRYNRNPGRVLAMMLIDIDHFKDLNDTEGHQMGDQVLRTLAEVIRACIRRDVDSAYRYGGDEFIIILPDTDRINACNVGERIQKQFGAFKFGHTSLSIGITEANANESEKQLLRRADEAMYQSKRGGRARTSTL
jgi:diguanylate cyclase (GGDEF)-like protein/PAS domain S-box-containing protein